ncbi:hypothetical protein [Helicobacter pametensis]|uniref:hypothetical protein n=1 Tax=Helicobacter pametensis TaxID=95149 RepID=UPI0030B82D25
MHFLDSDDWFELDCIEKCVRVAQENQAQIVWHGCGHFYECENKVGESDFLKKLGLDKNKSYSGLEIFSLLPHPSFSWVAMGIVQASLIYKVCFKEGIESEDALFGMQIFALAQNISFIFDNLYIYRIRPNSISQHTLGQKGDSQDHKISFPKHQEDLVDAFQNAYDVRHYSFAYSCAIICVEMDRFIQREALSNELKQRLIAMIEHRAIFAFGGCGFQKDPRNIRGICSHLTPYMKKVRIGSKIAYHYPRLYRLLKAIKRSIR